jgi:hypothetical protein
MNPNPRIVKQIFKTIDQDHNDYMEFDEFMDFLLMMRHGNIKDKASFVFDLISQLDPLDSINFLELVIFYFKIIDEFGHSQDPDLLIDEDITEYINGTIEDKEIFLGDLDRNLVLSFSLTDVFFNLMQVDLDSKISKKDFVEFMDLYPRTMDLFNFIYINDKDFRNVESINKTNQYIDFVSRIIMDIEGMLGVGQKNPTVSRIRTGVTYTNMQDILEKVDKIQQKIEESIDQSFQEEVKEHSFKGFKNIFYLVYLIF